MTKIIIQYISLGAGRQGHRGLLTITVSSNMLFQLESDNEYVNFGIKLKHGIYDFTGFIALVASLSYAATLPGQQRIGLKPLEDDVFIPYQGTRFNIFDWNLWKVSVNESAETEFEKPIGRLENRSNGKLVEQKKSRTKSRSVKYFNVNAKC